MRLPLPSFACLLIGFLSLRVALPCPAQTPPAPDASLVHFISDPAVDPGFDVEVIELQRVGNISKLQVFHRKGAPRGTLVLTTKAIYQIAKARHAAYFITLQEKLNRDASRGLVVGFPDTPDPDVQTAFDQPYKETNDSGKKRVCFSVAECAVLFEPPAPAANP